jgi:GR25 family glycosyltransferase involved in LPS biosynthesis
MLSRIRADPRYEIVEINAVDGRSDVVDDREPFMSPGQAGCFLSHVYFWKQIAARPEPFALVLEDDAMIYLPDKLPDLVGLVESLPERWDVLYLGGVYQNHRDGHPHEITRINDKIVKSDAFMFFSHAYVITREAAAELLAQSEHISTGGPDGSSSSSLRAFDSVIPVDEWMTHEDRKMNVYNTDPVFVTKSDDGVSDTYDMPPPPTA